MRKLRHQNLSQRALTLIEMVVVLLGIAALVGISVVGLGSGETAVRKSASRELVRSVLLAQTDAATYDLGFTSDIGRLFIRKADVDIVAGAAYASGQVSMAVGVDGSLALSGYVEDGICAEIALSSPLDTTSEIDFSEGHICDATNLLSVAGRTITPLP